MAFRPNQRQIWEKADWSLRDCELSQQYGCTKYVPGYWRKLLGKPTTPNRPGKALKPTVQMLEAAKRRQQVLELYERPGETIETVAEKLGISTATIQHIRHPRHWAANRAIARKMKPSLAKVPNQCEACGKFPKLIHAHHPNYDDPFRVVWLCVPCHGQLHRLVRIMRKAIHAQT